jgi:FAD:protein FMN transferase
MIRVQIVRRSKICIAGFLFFCSMLSGCLPATTAPTLVVPEILKSSGETMGTYYVVTIADPPESLPTDWAEQVDRELRLVNDQMSTYLKSSEISRFNTSTSTDWFEVSADLANVVQVGLDISEITDGAFDVTVAPLVNAWNFGPTKRSNRPPTDDEISDILAKVGYEKLSVRSDPPALRKEIPTLTIDLSAIAKGHGVDRLVELLRGLGCQNVFVDIGGEDRAIGMRGDREWRVAIEDPNDHEREYHLAFALDNQAIATSGDYRNFFEFEGERYSHTIDPRTGRPVTNQVASVSVFANDCMTADGWATALTVLGPEKAVQLAESLKLPVRVVTRADDGAFTVSKSSLFPKEIASKPEG